jgi:hypothetical protein
MENLTTKHPAIHTKITDQMAVYVGTYGKYNDGSIYGAWIDLTLIKDEEDFNEFNFHEYETFNLKSKFSSFREFKEYADNEIPDIIINYIVRILPKTREESGGWD